MAPNESLFADSIIENYHRYMVPLLFDDYARDLVGRTAVPPGGRILEIACGTGVVTRYLASTMHDGTSLLATDISPDMVAAARRIVPDSAAVEFRPADGTELPFEDDSFDAVVCQFGVMFYPDRKVGYREAARVIKPRGTFVFNTWDALERNPIPRVVHETVAKLSPDTPPNFLAAPFGYHDLSTVRDELQQSGFGRVEIAVLPRTSRAPSARDVAVGVVQGSPLAGQLAERQIGDKALEAVEHALVEAFGDGEIAVPMQAIAVVAHLDRAA